MPVSATNKTANSQVVSTSLLSTDDEDIRQRECADTPAEVFSACRGCHPVVETFSNFSHLYPMNETTRQVMSSCVTTAAGFNIRSFDLFKANVSVCTEKKILLDEAQKNAMGRVLDALTAEAASSTRAKAWDACAERVISAGRGATPETDQPSQTPVPSEPLVPDLQTQKK